MSVTRLHTCCVCVCSPVACQLKTLSMRPCCSRGLIKHSIFHSSKVIVSVLNNQIPNQEEINVIHLGFISGPGLTCPAAEGRRLTSVRVGTYLSLLKCPWAGHGVTIPAVTNTAPWLHWQGVSLQGSRKYYISLTWQRWLIEMLSLMGKRVKLSFLFQAMSW